MFDIQLEINGYSLRLGMAISDCRLYLSGKRTSKVGFLHSIIMGITGIVRKNETVYFSMNCTIDCFNNKLTIVPNLNRATGADEMYGTSGFVFFKGGLINRIYIQVIDNRKYAVIFFDKFQSICESIYGKGEYNSKLYNESWEENESILEIGWSPKHGNVFLDLKRKLIINLSRSLEEFELGTAISVFENSSKWKEVLNHSFPGQRLFSMYSDDKQFVYYFKFNRLRVISLTTLATQADFYLKQFTKKYGIPNKPKRNEYLWANDSTSLLLVKGRELSILMEDKNK